MNIHLDEHKGVLTFVGTLHISKADEMHRALVEQARGEAAAIKLDLSGVEACDAPSLQLLYSLRKSVVRANRSLEVVAFSEAIRETCTALGLPMEELSGAAECAAD